MNGAGGSFMAGSIVAKMVVDKTGWDEAIAGAVRQNEHLANVARQTAQTLSAFGRQLTMIGGAVVAFAGLSVAAFTKFDDAMTQSMAIMGDLSASTKKDLSGAAKEISRITTFSSTEAAKAFYFLASAGMSAQESIKALPVVAKFAQAGMFDLEKATTLLADAQTALGLRVRDDAVKNMENMTRVADVLSKANILANDSIEGFSEALTNRAGAALRLVGKDVEEGAAALAVMANQGIKGAEAGTRLDIVMRDLQTRAIKNEAAFDKYNVTVFDTRGEMRNLADIFEDLTKAMAGKSDEQRRSILMEMEFQDRSVASILALIGMSDELRRYEKELRNAQGTTDEIAKKQLESLKSQITLTKNEVSNLAEAIGEGLAPLVKMLNEGLRSLVKQFTDMTEGNKAFVGALTSVTAIFGVLTLGVGLGTIALGHFLTSMAAISVAAPALATALGFIQVALAGVGIGLAIVVAGFAGWKIGEWIGKVTGLNQVVQAAASGVIWLGQQVGLVRKPVEELEASEFRLARRHLFLATASSVAGHEVKNLVEAVQILKAEFAEKGTVGDLGLDTWLAKVKIASLKTKEFQDPLEGLNNIIPGLGDKLKTLGGNVKEWLGSIPEVAKWWKDLGDKMAPLTDKAKAAQAALDAIFKKYEVEGKTAIQQALEQAQDDLEVLKASAEATPGAIQAIEDKIREYKDQLIGFSAAQEKAKTIFEKAKRSLEAYKDAFSKAAGFDVKELLAYNKALAEGSELPLDIVPELSQEDWDAAWKGIEQGAKDSQDVVKGILGDLVNAATNAGYASSKGIEDGLAQLRAGGTITEVKFQIALLQEAMKMPGLTTDRIRAFEDEIKRLQGILADTTPWGKFISGVSTAFAQLQSMVSPIIDQISMNSQTKIENDYKKRLEYINKTVTDEEAKQKAIEALEAEYQIKKTNAARQAATVAKAVALMGAIINTAEGYTKALAQGGFIFGIPMAAVVAALGAVQIGLIAAQPIPLAEGATFESPTLLQNVLTAENRPEHMLDEPKLIDIVQQAMERPRFTETPAFQPAMAGAAAGGAGSIVINGPLIQTTGISRRDLVEAAEQMKEIILYQIRRKG